MTLREIAVKNLIETSAESLGKTLAESLVDSLGATLAKSLGDTLVVSLARMLLELGSGILARLNDIFWNEATSRWVGGLVVSF